VGLDPHPTAVALARRNAAALGLGEAQYRVVQGRIEEAATMYVRRRGVVLSILVSG
jgi:methylase of polypeptide subunit release factors